MIIYVPYYSIRGVGVVFSSVLSSRCSALASGHWFQVAVGSGSRCSARGSGHGGSCSCRCCTRSSDSVARAVQGALLLDWERHAVGNIADGSQ